MNASKQLNTGRTATILTFAAISTLLSGSVSVAESINVDIGTVGGVPGPTYGAAGEAGTWNGVDIPDMLGDIQTGPLLDTSGQMTNVTLSIVSLPFAGNVTGFADPADYPSGDAYALLHDQVNCGFMISGQTPYGTAFDFSGLAPGTYDVITYATPTAVTLVQTVVSLDDDPMTAKTTTGAFGFPFVELIEDVTHVVHRNVVVGTGETLRIIAHSVQTSDQSFVNGFQVAPSASSGIPATGIGGMLTMTLLVVLGGAFVWARV